MTGGAGFTRDGVERSRVNRSWLKKKLPFQRLKENLFLKAPKLNMEINESTLEDLHRMKTERRLEEKFKRRFFAIFIAVILLIVFGWFSSWLV